MLLLLSAVAMSGLSTPSQAANWLMLQGTEPESAAARAKVWGFVQAQYQVDNSDPNGAGGYNAPKLVGPNLDSQQQFNVNRARIGIRGQGMPLDGKVNYFMLAEFGNNAITAVNNDVVSVTDASITVNHFKGARIRMGLFKYPGAEEGLAAIHVFDYINFTEVSNQLLLERFAPTAYTANGPGTTTLPAATGLNNFDKSVGAYRDVGIQVFETFKQGNWEHAYAAMIGNGNGLNYGDSDDNKDLYLYWASELVFGGKGPFREHLKIFAWSQTGKRQLDNTGDATHNPVEYDRDRSGFGVKYLKKPFRGTFEYMKGEGMIFVGPNATTFDMNPAAAPGNGENGKASGYYLDFGYYIPNSNWDVGVRYDEYNRLEGDTFEIKFATTTFVAQYMFNKKTRLTINHALRDFEAINFGSGAGPNAQLDGVDTRTAIQVTHIF